MSVCAVRLELGVCVYVCVCAVRTELKGLGVCVL